MPHIRCNTYLYTLVSIGEAPGRYSRLFPAALFWSWPPAAVAQSIYGSLRQPALQSARIRLIE
ncbi:MAG: hypothetical protein RSD83_18170 [Hafnia sp.]|uniref:hypothetical protein n=1 Tax=Hafnia sp. TaxID=1873498 RepID=UPI002FC74536